jgi:hypothetical protein
MHKEMGKAYKILVLKPRRRCEDNIKKGRIKVGCLRSAFSLLKRPFLNTNMNAWFPGNAVYLLAS